MVKEISVARKKRHDVNTDKVPLCKRCRKYEMVLLRNGDYFCNDCGYIGDPMWITREELLGESTNKL